MFVVESSLQHLPARRESIACLSESSNQPYVAVPGKQAQATQAFVVGLRDAPDTYAMYICLWLTLTRESVIYRFDGKLTRVDALEQAQNDALQFCEEMGFIMDAISYRRMTPDAQAALLDRLPPFQADPARRQSLGPVLQPLPPAAPPLGPSDITPGPARATVASPLEAARVARLLASF